MGYTSVIKREFKRLSDDPLGLFLSFIFPLLMCLLICFIFGKGIPKNLPIGVWNGDNSQLSRLIVRNLNSMQGCKVKYQLTSLKEGKDLIEQGKIYAFVVIPKNFERDIYRMQQPKLVYYYNNHRILIGGILTKDIGLMAQSMIVGIDAKFRNKKGMPFKEAVKQSNLINVVEHTRSNPYFNYQYLLSLAAFGHILQVFMVFTAVWAIGTEFKQGKTKEWLKESNDSIIIALAGKMTPYLALFLITFIIIYLVYFGIYQVPYNGNHLMGLISTTLFIFSALALGIMFISINGNFRYCLSFSAFYVAMGFALAGMTYPTISMPLFARLYGYTSPLNYWIRVMIDQSLRDIPVIYDVLDIIAPLIIIIVVSCFIPRLKSMAKDENRWYKI